MRRHYSKNNWMRQESRSLEQDFLAGNSNLGSKYEPSQWKLEHQWDQDAFDEKQVFKREELEWELRNERG